MVTLIAAAVFLLIVMIDLDRKQTNPEATSLLAYVFLASIAVIIIFLFL